MIRKSILEKFNNKDGAALITVLIIFLTLVVIVTASSQTAVSNYKRVKKSSDTSSVYYIAEAGDNDIFEEIKEYHQLLIDVKKIFDDTFANSYVEDFYDVLQEKENRSIDGHIINITYPHIMNQKSNSEVEFSHIGKASNGESEEFKLKSKKATSEFDGFTTLIIATSIPSGVSLLKTVFEYISVIFDT